MQRLDDEPNIRNSGINVIKDTVHQQFYGPSVDPMEVIVAIERAYNAYGYPLSQSVKV